jgi:hypothetical protein
VDQELCVPIPNPGASKTGVLPCERLGPIHVKDAAKAAVGRTSIGDGIVTTAELTSTITAVVAVLTFAVGVGTFLKAILEYKRQNRAKRFEIFQGLNKRFDEPQFVQLREMLDCDSPALVTTDYVWKHNFLGFFEEIAISVNSDVMDAKVAFYMFGYYAIRCWKSENFWLGDKMLEKNSVYWSLFEAFATRMMKMEAQLGSGYIDTNKLRF